MAKEGGETMRIKLLVEKQGKRVLFAEAGKDFVDFLFHVMTLPVGTVIKLLNKNGMVGCVGVGNLNISIQNISTDYLESHVNKEALLEPKAPPCGANFPLQLPVSTPVQKAYYKCSVGVGSCPKYHFCCSIVADHPNATCSQCGTLMTQRVSFLKEERIKGEPIPSNGYVKEVLTYMVLDDLEVKPMSVISCITVLKRLDVKDVGAVEEKVVTIATNEALELLKASLCSKNVLTDVFFGKV